MTHPKLEPGGLRSLQARLTLAGGLSLLAWVVLQWLAPPPVLPWTPAMLRAARTVAAALDTTGAHCRGRNIPMDPLLDPAETCLVGPELTPLFTTLGQLEAKRTTLTPDLAGLLVHLLREAGVEAGDTVAIGASGSFPGLLLGTLAAVEAVGAVPVTILSLGSSSYGATRPEFHLLDLHRLLNRAGRVDAPPAAVSLGGEGDVGKGFPETLRNSLAQEVRSLGIPFLEEDSLEGNVARRMAIYCGSHGRMSGSGACPVAAFVNVGGAQANLGVSPAVLEVPPGLNRNLAGEMTLPPDHRRGVLFAMASRGIPIIHLLNVRGLALGYGLPWDPLSSAEAGTTALRSGIPSRGGRFWLVTAAYLLGLTLLLLPPFLRRVSSPGHGAKTTSIP